MPRVRPTSLAGAPLTTKETREVRANVRLQGSPHPWPPSEDQGPQGKRGAEAAWRKGSLWPEGQVGTADSSHHTAFGGQEPMGQPRGVPLENKEGNRFPTSTSRFVLCSLPSKLWEVWMRNFHQMEQTHTHTPTVGAFLRVRSKESHQAGVCSSLCSSEPSPAHGAQAGPQASQGLG